MVNGREWQRYCSGVKGEGEGEEYDNHDRERHAPESSDF